MSRVIKSNIQQNNSAHCPKILIKPVAIMAPMIKKKDNDQIAKTMM